MTGAGTGEQEREPGIYTGGVKSIHEHTAWVSFPNTEMKLTVILRVDQGTDQKSSYWSYEFSLQIQFSLKHFRISMIL